jgi:tetratricopeptide (TPR) repeat protein
VCDPALAQLRLAFHSDAGSAFREFFRLQERLAAAGDDARARLLADELFTLLPELSLASEEDRARLFHNAAVFFGSAGPAASLPRAVALFEVPLAFWKPAPDAGDHARALHNKANALSNLGTTSRELLEAVHLFEEALLYRTTGRVIARGVTLHNLAAAFRRLADLVPGPERLPLLARGLATLEEAISIREGAGLPEGAALSLFHLGITYEAAAREGLPEGCRLAEEAFTRAADAYDALGKTDEATMSRRLGEEAGSRSVR